MTAADIPLGMRLKSQAGWNQTEADWRRMLSLADGGAFVGEWAGAAVGTAVTVSFGPIAWIAMVLVNVADRGRGIGRQLVQAAISHAESRGAVSIRLDATPLGRAVYETMGFVPQFELTRWDGVPRTAQSRGRIPDIREAPLDAIVELDRSVTGTCRQKLLEHLVREDRATLCIDWNDQQVVGLGMTRLGSEARFVGPCVAETPSGAELLARLLETSAGQRAFIDVPRGNHAAEVVVRDFGLVPQRTLLRMTRGQPLREDLECLFASSGPELG